MKTKEALLALASAATAGVVIGIFTAPEKGSDLRKRLVNHTGKFACELGDLINRSLTKYKSIKSEILDQVAGIEIGKKNRPTINLI